MSAPTTSVATPNVAEASRSYGDSTLGAVATLYGLSLRQHFHGKRWLIVTLMFLLPAGLALLVRLTAPRVPPEMLDFLLGMMFIPQILLPIAALLYASGVIQDEQEEQTLTYLLIRPLPKWAIYASKFLATATTTVLLTFTFTLVTFAVIYIGTDQFLTGASRGLRAAGIHSLAIVAYCSLFGLMSLITRRTLVIGIVYSVLIEGVCANFPFGIRLLTVIYYSRLIAYRVMKFAIPRPHGGGAEDAANIVWQLKAEQDPKLLAHPELSTCFLVLIVGSLVCTAIAAFLCTRREFHVKTPEKA